MASYMEDESDKKESENISFTLYTNVCLTLIVIFLMIIAITSLIDTLSRSFSNSGSIEKIAICDPINGRCVKVNAGRRLETTN